MWGVGVHLQILSEGGMGCKTGLQVLPRQGQEGYSRCPRGNDVPCLFYRTVSSLFRAKVANRKPAGLARPDVFACPHPVLEPSEIS